MTYLDEFKKYIAENADFFYLQFDESAIKFQQLTELIKFCMIENYEIKLTGTYLFIDL